MVCSICLVKRGVVQLILLTKEPKATVLQFNDKSSGKEMPSEKSKRMFSLQGWQGQKSVGPCSTRSVKAWCCCYLLTLSKIQKENGQRERERETQSG